MNPDFNLAIILHYLELIKDKVTTEKQSFPSVIIKQFAYQVQLRLILQLINGILRNLQKLFRYFNDTIISTDSVTSFTVRLVIFCLNLNKGHLLLAAEKLPQLASKNVSSL